MPVANCVSNLVRHPSTDWTAILPPSWGIQGTIYGQVKLPFGAFVVFPRGCSIHSQGL